MSNEIKEIKVELISYTISMDEIRHTCYVHEYMIPLLRDMGYEVVRVTPKEKKEKRRFLPFDEACEQFSMDEIYTMAQAAYMLQVGHCGGVIE